MNILKFMLLSFNLSFFVLIHRNKYCKYKRGNKGDGLILYDNVKERVTE